MIYGRNCMNLLHFTRAKFLLGEETIMKSVSEPLFKNIRQNYYYAYLEYAKKKENMNRPYL